MELRLLRYFIAVAEEHSFTRAAERLFIAQPSLSQQIKQLEAYVGTPLLVRDKHRVELTEAGRTFLREARNVLSCAERAVNLTRQTARAEAGLITVALVPGPEAKMFSAVFAELIRKYPNIEIVLRSLSSPEQVAALKKCEINVGFLRGPIDDEEIASEVMVREDLVVVLPADHPLAKESRIKVEKLAGLPFVHVSRAIAPALHDAIDKVAVDAGFRFHSVLDTESITAILNAIASGLGVGVHAQYVEQMCPKNVVVRPFDLDRIPKVELVVAYRKDDKLPALASFLSLLQASKSHG